MTRPRRHTIAIVGAGSAGVSVAARLKRAGAGDVAIIDPYDDHYYQPLWTLVGGGLAKQEASVKRREDVLPPGVMWIKAAATGVDPEARTVSLSTGEAVRYSQLVMAPGLQLDWDKVDGLRAAVGRDGISSNYRFDLAPKTWELIASTTRGTAVFTMPSGPIKCAGAPQKIAYLACDYWRKTGVLSDIDVHLVLPTPGMFGIPKFAAILKDVAENRYGITVHLESELTAVDPATRTATITKIPTGETSQLAYTMMHVAPPQSAPDWVKASPLANPDDPNGYVHIDQYTMQHVRHPEVYALGDAGSSPNSKTGAAVRHQAPVVVQNMKDTFNGRAPSATYDGYASCPLTTSRNHLLLAEFDYSMQPAPSYPLPWPDTTDELVDLHTFKKYGLPILYWHFMLKGLV